MKLQNILFPSTDTCTEEPMYFRRGDKVFYNWSSDGVEIQKDGILFFDTYFNGFTIEKWAKYTNVKTVSLTVRIEGHVRLTLMRKEKKGNQILTDFLGEYICKANYLILEANYDEEMLKMGSYPQYLKERIAGSNGHMSNRETAEFLAENINEGLKYIWLCHLSKDNNHPELAYKTVEWKLKNKGIIVGKDVQLLALKRNTPSELYVFE